MSPRLRFPWRYWSSLLGWPGAAGAAGLAAALAVYFSVLLPAQQQLETARLSVGSLHQRLARASQTLHDNARPLDEQLGVFYRSFPGERDAPDWIGKIAAIAQRDGLALQQAEYKVDRDKIGKLTHVRMSMPLRGEYQAIRKFLADLRAEIPIVSLEQVQFERQKVGDALVDAKIRLGIFLENAS